MKWPCSRAMLNYHRVIHRSWVITQFLRQTPISLYIETVHTWRSCKVHTWRSSWSGMQHAVYAALKGAFFLCNSVLVYVRKRKNNISLWLTYLLIFFWGCMILSLIWKRWWQKVEQHFGKLIKSTKSYQIYSNLRLSFPSLVTCFFCLKHMEALYLA